ncbi:MAG TPA: hypothetical protein VMT05_00745 [Terriglobales bacterium]|nr:hypothetical protein [Terriglobales bacterium]
MNIVNDAIKIGKDFATGDISNIPNDVVKGAVDGAPLLLGGPAGGIASLAASALGGTAASSIFGSAAGQLPNIASGLLGTIGNIFGKGTSGGSSAAGSLDPNNLGDLQQQLNSDTQFQKNMNDAITAAKREQTILGAELDLALSALSKIHG